ncbi:hypothetical protein BC629DRAFT_756335 [Irpex lacteus]|nr:hypothetical protein BC629DRAFT_756335 [Irpex lacteus]
MTGVCCTASRIVGCKPVVFFEPWSIRVGFVLAAAKILMVTDGDIVMTPFTQLYLAAVVLHALHLSNSRRGLFCHK